MRSILSSRKARGFFALIGYGLSVAVNFSVSRNPMVAIGTVILAISFSLYLFWPQVKSLRIIPPKGAIVEPAGWLYFFGVASCALVIVAAINVYISSHQAKQLSDSEFAQPYLVNKYVRIADIADANGVIEGRTFRDCWLYEPAVVFLQNYVESDNDHFDGAFETIFTPVNQGTVLGRGAIIVRDCHFTNCHFVRVSFLASQQDIEKWKSAMALAGEGEK